MWVITFDIDGTMEFGDPNGILTREHVLGFRAQGALIGSASDRPESSQLLMWRAYGIEPDIVVLKHRMIELREQFPDAEAYWHVGDRPMDQMMARQAGFTFFWPDQFPSPAEYLAEAVSQEDSLEEAAEKLAAQTMQAFDLGPPIERAAVELAAQALNGHGPSQPSAAGEAAKVQKDGDGAPAAPKDYALS